MTVKHLSRDLRGSRSYIFKRGNERAQQSPSEHRNGRDPQQSTIDIRFISPSDPNVGPRIKTRDSARGVVRFWPYSGRALAKGLGDVVCMVWCVYYGVIVGKKMFPPSSVLERLMMMCGVVLWERLGDWGKVEDRFVWFSCEMRQFRFSVCASEYYQWLQLLLRWVTVVSNVMKLYGKTFILMKSFRYKT